MTTYYTRQASIITGTKARAEDVNAEYNAIVTAFANVATILDRCLKHSDAATTTDQAFAGNAAARVGKGVIFDGSGNATLTTYLQTSGGTLTGALTGTDLSLSGNLTLTGAGKKITGDFTNATVANRLCVQTSAGSNVTLVTILPNGSVFGSGVDIFSTADGLNASFFRVSLTNSSARLNSSWTGAGTVLPINLAIGGSDKLSLTTGGDLDLLTGSNSYKVAGTAVLGSRKTGWTAATGVATRSTFATGSVTLSVLAEHVKALIDDLISHGMIGT